MSVYSKSEGSTSASVFSEIHNNSYLHYSNKNLKDDIQKESYEGHFQQENKENSLTISTFDQNSKNFEKNFSEFHLNFYVEMFDLFNNILDNSDNEKCFIEKKELQKLMKYFSVFKDYQQNYQDLKMEYEQLKEKYLEIDNKLNILASDNHTKSKSLFEKNSNIM